MNNEQNKLLAALVGDCFWDEYVAGPYVCHHCGKPHANTDYFGDPPHSKIVELVGKAVEKFDVLQVEAALGDACSEYGYTTDYWTDALMLPADRIASAIVNLIKEQDAK